MQITRLFDFSKGYITLFLAFNDAFVALNVHYKAFSPPSALYLLASAHALNAIRFAIHLRRWIERNAHRIRIEQKRIHVNASEPD